MSEEWYQPRVLRDYEGEEGVARGIADWWTRLNGEASAQAPALPSGARAVLRRSTGPDDALLTDGFRHLWLGLPQKRQTTWDMRAWGGVALALAEVSEHVPDLTFAGAMAKEREPHGSHTPRVSELRFQQLLRSRDLDEFIRRVRRAIHLIGGKVDVRSVADDCLLWHREKNGQFAARPDHRLAVRWADAYFSGLARYQPAGQTG
ncbi:CRISPR system Cascade subunit CasB [Thiohalospira halophila DSM 15071]|uniref:CRISPR system Cascade subunit CasB n=1 Tax=Thiohalospira halophila DSM 15071 TaxID=1123397 RepID=A0A1I1S597_9GAMM|nr:type I-E CRISPR-associated protein Cse2/CasB [Thiohalospira halophila]SFD41676.1 CRISPR system Cascade subunit CasB [Thiohalospira halophila DSM 15071]